MSSILDKLNYDLAVSDKESCYTVILPISNSVIDVTTESLNEIAKEKGYKLVTEEYVASLEANFMKLQSLIDNKIQTRRIVNAEQEYNYALHCIKKVVWGKLSKEKTETSKLFETIFGIDTDTISTKEVCNLLAVVSNYETLQLHSLTNTDALKEHILLTLCNIHERLRAKAPLKREVEKAIKGI